MGGAEWEVLGETVCSVIGQQCGRRLAALEVSSERGAELCWEGEGRAVREASPPVLQLCRVPAAQPPQVGPHLWRRGGVKKKEKKVQEGEGEKEAEKIGRLKLVVPGCEGRRRRLWASPVFRFTFSPMLGGGAESKEVDEVGKLRSWDSEGGVR